MRSQTLYTDKDLALSFCVCFLLILTQCYFFPLIVLEKVERKEERKREGERKGEGERERKREEEREKYQCEKETLIGAFCTHPNQGSDICP